MWQTLQLWYSVSRCYSSRLTENLYSRLIGHAYGSAYIRGQETLGMEPITDPQCTFLKEGIPIPRMVVAQFDGIRLHRCYKPLSPLVLRSYQERIKSLDPRSWFTIYLTTALLLDLVPTACADRLRQRKQHALPKVLFPCPDDVQLLIDYDRRRDMGPKTTN